MWNIVCKGLWPKWVSKLFLFDQWRIKICSCGVWGDGSAKQWPIFTVLHGGNRSQLFNDTRHPRRQRLSGLCPGCHMKHFDWNESISIKKNPLKISSRKCPPCCLSFSVIKKPCVCSVPHISMQRHACVSNGMGYIFRSIYQFNKNEDINGINKWHWQWQWPYMMVEIVITIVVTVIIMVTITITIMIMMGGLQLIAWAGVIYSRLPL